MVINEKALVRQMKEAYKGWGYTVIRRPGGKWFFRTARWVVEIDGQGNVPNEVLSLIVLHTGELPNVESAARIYKTDTGPAIQKEVYAVANQDLQKLERQTDDATENTMFAQRTKLHLGHCRVWQKEDLGILLMDPAETSMIHTKDDIMVVGDWLYADGESSRIWVSQQSGDGENAHIKHLSEMQWIQT